MNQRKLLPKKLISFAILISMVYLVGILSLTMQLSSQFEAIHKTHLPLLEMNAINIRIGDSLTSRTKNLIYEYSERGYEEYQIDKDSLNFNFKSYLHTLKSSGVSLKFDKDFNRDALYELEDRILALAKEKKKVEALELITSDEYKLEQTHFLNSIQGIAEKLSEQRDLFLKEQVRIIQLEILFSAITFVLITILWLKVYFSYRRNVRDRNRALDELELERVKSSHNAKMASLGEMAAGLAHEINNPLTIIQGFSERLLSLVERREFSEEKVERYAEKIYSTTKRINQMIQGLKVFSKNSGDNSFVLSPVEGVIEDTLSFCRERFKSSGIDLHQICDEEEEVYIMARPVEISQVLLNLLNNAFDELQDSELIHSWIKIEAKQDDDFVYICVADSGLGITDEVKEKIFDPFFTTKEGSHGTGLGLSISSSIVKKHGGEFYLDNSVTTEFIIKLPRPKLNSDRKAA